MLSTFAALLLAAGVVTPQPTQQLFNPETGAPRLEVGVLSAPLQGDLVVAVRDWALTQRTRYGLPANATLRSLEALSTRFGASFHLQQVVDGLDVYQAQLVVTLDAQRRVVQVASSLETTAVALAGETLSTEQAMARAAASLPLVALRPDGVPYGGARAFYFPVGAALHRGWLANVQSLDFSKNWYVAVDAVTGERLFAQNRVHHGALDAKVYPVSPGGLDAGVGATATVTRQLAHADGGSMIGDTCALPLLDGGLGSFPNDAGQLCGTQLMTYNCCPTADCVPDAGARRLTGQTSFMGIPVTYDVAVCDRVRRASNVTNGTADYVYAPVDPPANKTAVVATDLANSDEFAEVHAFYHVNTVYDWMRKLSQKGAPIFGSQPAITPFVMRDERRTPAVKVSVWSNVMFPNFNELVSGGGSCLFNPPCRANTLLRIDNAAFFPREQFSQLPLPGFDTGSDTLMIFQGNQADAAYDATVIQHEFGHGAVYATANITFDTVALDQRSANNEGGALHEGFADYIAAAFNNLPEVGPYFGPRASAGQALPGVAQDTYLRTMENTYTCPSVLWGEVHQDAQHVAAALWKARKNVFQGTDQGETYDAAFYAMLVSITPNADFAMVATAMAARVATAFPSISTASAQMTQIFEEKGVINCSKVLDATSANLPRPYFGIASSAGTLGNSLIPGPFQFKVAGAQGVGRITVTGVSGGGGPLGGGGGPAVQVLTRKGTPMLFARQGGVLQNNSEQVVAMAAGANNTQTASVQVNSPCGTDVYVVLAAAGGGATLQNVNVTVEPLVNCMIPVADAGAGGGGGTGGGAGGGGGTGGGSGGTTTLPSVGPGSTTEQPPAAVGCGCSSGVDALALGALAVLVARRRRAVR